MRYFQIRLVPKEGGFHRLDELTAGLAAVDREAILHLAYHTDGSGTALFQLTGDPAALEALYRETDIVRYFEVFESEQAGFLAHVHVEPDDPAMALLEVVERYNLIVDPPLSYTDEGGLRLTAAGPQDLVREAALAVPDSVDAHLELVGDYEPRRDSLASLLTERQREVLSTAVEMGYYAIPREATHDDLAAALDCSAGTVGEHLRKIEARVLSELAV